MDASSVFRQSVTKETKNDIEEHKPEELISNLRNSETVLVQDGITTFACLHIGGTEQPILAGLGSLAD